MSSNLRQDAINIVNAIPDEHLQSVVSILQNVENITGKNLKKNKVTNWQEIIDKYSGSAACYKGLDVEAYIKELRS